MAVQLSSLEILEQADFPQAQARAIVRVLEGEAATRREDLATKADLADLRHATRADLAEFRQATTAELVEFRQATTAELIELRQASKTDLAELRHVSQLDIARLEGKFGADIGAAKSELVKWLFLFTLGQFTLTAGIVQFLLKAAR
ncbi:MAG: hypothetical protein ABJC66_06040 [Gammaproteobacteria bacterium]